MTEHMELDGISASSLVELCMECALSVNRCFLQNRGRCLLRSGDVLSDMTCGVHGCRCMESGTAWEGV
jgi:hypothetical protein